MPNGIDGWIADRTSGSDDAVREALEYEASEERDRRRQADNDRDDFDEPVNRYTDDAFRTGRDDVSQADIDFNSWLSEMGGNTRIDTEGFTRDIQKDLGRRIEEERQRMAEEEFDLLDWLADLFGNARGGLASFDIDMPTPSIAGLSALGLLPNILIGFTQAMVKLFTIDEETFVEDTIRMLALQDKLKERLGEVVK